MIEGEVYFDRSKDIQRRAEIERERQELEKLDVNKPSGTTTTQPRVPAERRIEERDEAEFVNGGNN
jgi:hypothetical protein